MRSEVPQFRRCCFCIPLRRGLIGWGYARLVINLLAISYLVLIAGLIGVRYVTRMRDIAILLVIFACVIADTIFNIVFIVAGHMKSVKMLKVSYIYNIIWMCLLILGHSLRIYMVLSFLCSTLPYLNHRTYYVVDVIVRFGFAFGVIFVQTYFILLIRSEMEKLRNQSMEIQFTNHYATGEPQCTVQNASKPDMHQCTTEKASTITHCSDENSRDIIVSKPPNYEQV